MKRDVTNFCVAYIPGWESPWCELNTSRRKDFGTYGLTMSADTSQYISASWPGKRIFFNRNAVVPELTMSLSSLSFSCAAARV